VYHVGVNNIWLSISQDKWDKGKASHCCCTLELARHYRQALEKGSAAVPQEGLLDSPLSEPRADHSFLERSLPKHHVLEAPKQGEGGWKMMDKQWKAYLLQSLEEGSILKGKFEVIIAGNEPDSLPPCHPTLSSLSQSCWKGCSQIWRP
jgi:hypothetical protein